MHPARLPCVHIMLLHNSPLSYPCQQYAGKILPASGQLHMSHVLQKSTVVQPKTDASMRSAQSL